MWEEDVSLVDGIKWRPFRVAPSLCFKARLSAKPLTWKERGSTVERFSITFTSNCTTWSSLPFTCRLLFIISTHKLVVLPNFLSVRIVLNCFYLLIFYFEKFSKRLPFSVYVKLKPSDDLYSHSNKTHFQSRKVLHGASFWKWEILEHCGTNFGSRFLLVSKVANFCFCSDICGRKPKV